jgi:hypothetical protein
MRNITLNTTLDLVGTRPWLARISKGIHNKTLKTQNIKATQAEPECLEN